MGQTITVTARPGSGPGTRIFDCNRSLTGMAIERYRAAPPLPALRPPDVLARRLFDLGATHVTVYSNVVTVEAPPAAWGDLESKVTYAIEHLFEYYGEAAGWSSEALGVERKPSPVQ
jgi:hypothetical protein